jgi:hypothetical protein
VFTLTRGFDDECEIEEAEEKHVECLEAGEDSAEAFESSEEPFDLIALFVERAVCTVGIMPRLSTTCLGWSPS